MDLEKTNHPGYYKDKKTGMILNGNKDEYKSYREAIRRFRQIDRFEQELNDTKQKLDEITNLLKQLLDNKK